VRLGQFRLIALWAVVFALVGPSSATAQDLGEITEQRQAVENDFTRAVTAFDTLLDTVDAAEGELNGLRAQADQLSRDARRIQDALALRARTLFMQGAEPMFAILSSGNPSEAVERAGLLAAVNHREAGQLEEAVAVRTQLAQLEVLLEDRQVELELLVDELELRRDELEVQLDGLVAVETDLRERQTRQVPVNEGLLNGIYSCIFEINRTTFRDTWGASRGGGARRHKGTDVFAVHGEPVFAITSGTISRLNQSAIGGTSVYLRGDDGNLYYYTHLQGYVGGLYSGKRVEAGQHVAFNGASGNARGGAPHVHFQIHPGGGGPVNPYRSLARICFGRR
jgi:murein DD-endopeptidase MepM/ murein hydrolase activator NlpD